jgi:hypothetical protein
MSCELYKSEMYAWRPGSDVANFKPLFDHLATCPDCAMRFARLSASDHTIRQTFQELPSDRSLEARILAGLAHERAQTATRRRSWRSGLLPLAAAILLAIMLGIKPWLQQARLGRDIAGILSRPPAAEINSTDQKQLLDWSASALTGGSTLPQELSKVEFRAASSLNVADHKAVLLKMKNERRASLLIVDALVTREKGFRSFHEKAGSASLWSDGRRTYVLLFQGNEQEMHAYMSQMGIKA